MAKRATKTARPARRKSEAAAKRRRPRKIALKPVYRELKGRLSELRGVRQTKDVKHAIVRLTHCLSAIDDICGPDMVVIVEPEP